jgi:hypothetical protein
MTLRTARLAAEATHAAKRPARNLVTLSSLLRQRHVTSARGLFGDTFGALIRALSARVHTVWREGPLLARSCISLASLASH